MNEFIVIIQNINSNFKTIIETCNIESLRINLCKLLYYVNKMGTYIGINLDESFKIVHDSNMSKVCESEELAKKMNPDFFVVLPWHFKNFILNKEKKFLKKEGKIIFPLPDIEII